MQDRKSRANERGVREGMDVVDEGGSFKKDLRLTGRVPEIRGGITEGTIREFQLGGEK